MDSHQVQGLYPQPASQQERGHMILTPIISWDLLMLRQIFLILKVQVGTVEN